MQILTTENDFAEKISQNTSLKPIVVLFTSSWCGKCREIKPKLAALMKTLENRIEVYEVKCEELEDFFMNLEIDSLPHVRIYQAGESCESFTGSKWEKIETMIQEFLLKAEEKQKESEKLKELQEQEKAQQMKVEQEEIEQLKDQLEKEDNMEGRSSRNRKKTRLEPSEEENERTEQNLLDSLSYSLFNESYFKILGIPHLYTAVDSCQEALSHRLNTLVNDAFTLVSVPQDLDFKALYTWGLQREFSSRENHRNNQEMQHYGGNKKELHLALDLFKISIDEDLNKHFMTKRLWSLNHLLQELKQFLLVDLVTVSRIIKKETKKKAEYLIQEASTDTNMTITLISEIQASESPLREVLSCNAIKIQDPVTKSFEFYAPILDENSKVSGILQVVAKSNCDISPTNILHILQVSYDLGNINIGL